MADEMDPGEFLRAHRAVPPPAPAPSFPPSKAPSAGPPSAEASEGGIFDESNKDKWWYQAARGASKGLAGLAESAIRYAPYASPLTTPFAGNLQDLAEQSEYVQGLKRFRETPNESRWETAGDIAGQVAGTAAIPGLGAEALTARGLGALAARAPMVYIRGLGLVPGPTARTLTRAAPTISRMAGQSVKGALGGALGDPEHPGSAAAGGAAAGLVPTPVGKALRSPVGRWMGGVGLTEGAFQAAHHLTGLPYYPLMGPLIVWHSGPVGRGLRRVGNRIVDETGRIVGHIPAGATGYFAGPTVGEGGREAAETAKEYLRPEGGDSAQP